MAAVGERRRAEILRLPGPAYFLEQPLPADLLVGPFRGVLRAEHAEQVAVGKLGQVVFFAAPALAVLRGEDLDPLPPGLAVVLGDEQQRLDDATSKELVARPRPGGGVRYAAENEQPAVAEQSDARRPDRGLF